MANFRRLLSLSFARLLSNKSHGCQYLRYVYRIRVESLLESYCGSCKFLSLPLAIKRAKLHLVVAPLAAGFFSFKKAEPEDEKAEKEDVQDEQSSKAEEDDPFSNITNKVVKAQHDEVIMILKHAKLAEIKQDPVKAEEFYHKALAALQNYEKQGTWESRKILKARNYVHACMANMSFVQGKLDHAERLYKEAMHGLYQDGRPIDDDAMIEISLKIAMIYAMQNKKIEAETGYNFCIDSLEKKIKTAAEKGLETNQNSTALLGMCIDAYSRYMLMDKKYAQAEKLLDRAIAIGILVFEKDHPQLAVMYNDKGTLASFQKNDAAAKELVEKAIEIGKVCESPDLPTFYCNLGNINLNMGEHKEGKKQCQISYRLAKKLDDQQGMENAKKCMKKADEKK